MTENGGTSGVPRQPDGRCRQPPAAGSRRQHRADRAPQSSTTTITGSNLSYTSSTDSAAQLTYSITAGPTNGAITKSGSATTSFTQADVNGGLITYVQDGSDTTSDSFCFTVTDAESAQASGSFCDAASPRPVLADARLDAGSAPAPASRSARPRCTGTTETGKTSAAS